MSERCDDCGTDHDFGWSADEELWKDVVGQYGGLFCLECFTKRCAAAGRWCHWLAIDPNVYEEEEYLARRQLEALLAITSDAAEDIQDPAFAGEVKRAIGLIREGRVPLYVASLIEDQRDE